MHFQFTDFQWRKIVKFDPLPDAARPLIEDAIQYFREDVARWQTVPQTTKDRIDSTLLTIEKLTDLLKQCQSDGHFTVNREVDLCLQYQDEVLSETLVVLDALNEEFLNGKRRVNSRNWKQTETEVLSISNPLYRFLQRLLDIRTDATGRVPPIERLPNVDTGPFTLLLRECLDASGIKIDQKPYLRELDRVLKEKRNLKTVLEGDGEVFKEMFSKRID